MRKWSLAVIVGVLILGAAAAEEVTVEFWHWHYPNLEQVIAEFNAEYAGDIKIEAQLVDFGEYYTKLQVAILGGIGPDIGIMHTPVVPNWAQRGLLRPIDEDLAAIGVGPESFRPSYVWESTVYRSRQYGLPTGAPDAPLLQPQLAGGGGPRGTARQRRRVHLPRAEADPHRP